MIPNRLSAIFNSTCFIIVTWSKPEAGGGADDIEKYVVSWAPINENSKQEGEFNTTTANVTNLISNTGYNISVAANGALTKMGELSLVEAITGKLVT